MVDPKSLDRRTHISLYTSIHALTLRRDSRGDMPYCRDIYDRLTNYLRRYVQGVYADLSTQLDGEGLAGAYVEAWERYTAAAAYNDHLYRSLNRNWVAQQRDVGNCEVCEIYDLHFNVWKEEVLGDEQRNVKDTLLRLIDKGKTGSEIDGAEIKRVVASFAVLGIGDVVGRMTKEAER